MLILFRSFVCVCVCLKLEHTKLNSLKFQFSLHFIFAKYEILFFIDILITDLVQIKQVFDFLNHTFVKHMRTTNGNIFLRSATTTMETVHKNQQKQKQQKIIT